MEMMQSKESQKLSVSIALTLIIDVVVPPIGLMVVDWVVLLRGIFVVVIFDFVGSVLELVFGLGVVIEVVVLLNGDFVGFLVGICVDEVVIDVVNLSGVVDKVIEGAVWVVPFDLGELADGILAKVFVVDGCLVLIVVVELVVDIDVVLLGSLILLVKETAVVVWVLVAGVVKLADDILVDVSVVCLEKSWNKITIIIINMHT